MKTKKQRKLLAALLAVAMLIPQSLMTVSAAENTEPVYEHAEQVTVSNGKDALTPNGEVLDTMKASADATVNLTFTATGSGVQSLFFMGDNTKASNYIAVYVSGTKLGVESRNVSGGQQITDATYDMGTGTDLTKPHTLTFVMDGKSSYSFWLDGKKVKTANVTCNFNENLTASNYIGFGNGSRPSGQNSYPLTGTLSKVKLYSTVLSDEEITAYHSGELGSTVYSSKSAYYPTGGETYQTEKSVEKIAALSEGSVSVRYRLTNANAGAQMLMSLSNSTATGEYLGIYVTPSSNTVGIDAVGNSASMLGGKNLSLNRYPAKGVAVNDTNWHTITFTKADNDLKLYVDGVYVDHWSGGMSKGFFDLVNDADTLTVGKVTRSGSGSAMNVTGAIDSVKIYSGVLGEQDIIREHAATTWTAKEVVDMENAYRSETEELYYPGYVNSEYRIPSLLTTQKGTQLAFIDERNSGTQDAGNIDAVVRRKEKGQVSFDDPITLVDLPNNGGSAAFAIDMATVQDQKTGKIFAFVDMFPESNGLMAPAELAAGTGYEEVDGEMCQVLYNTTGTAKEKYGYIRNIQDGIGHVIGLDGEDTGYTVVVYPYEAGLSIQEKGNLYKEGTYRGNIYMLKASADKGELCVYNTSYMWLVTSEDDGKTWSDPIDITPQVKEDWTLFFGTGPGIGIQLHAGDHAGRLVVPIYTSNVNVGGSQSSAVIYSDDNGQTWKLGESPQTCMNNNRENMNNSGQMFTESQAVQLNNGDVLLFMRNTYANKVKMATSKDGGATWESVEEIDVPEVYCQLSAIHYNIGDKEYILMSNPSVSGRKGGMFHIGIVEGDTITWRASQAINTVNEKFQYSCLTLTDASDAENPKFAIMYEDDTNGMRVKYFEFDQNYLDAGMTTQTEMDAPQLVSADAQVSDGKVTVSLTFDQVIMAAGAPKLGLKLGETTVEAAYASGSGTETIVFTADMPEGAGVLKATGVTLTDGYLENIQNKSVTVGETKLYENTEIDLKGKTVAFSTQHSTSTAEGQDGAASNVIDGNEKTYWHSKWGDNNITLPQYVDIDLGETQTIYKVNYLARQNSASGRVQEYGIQVSTNGKDYTEVVHGTLSNTTAWQEIEFIPVEAKNVRFVAYNAYNVGNGSCAVAELKMFKYAEGVIEAGNTDALEALVDGYADLDEAGYSKVTWDEYAAALASAEMILQADMPVSQDMIDRAAANLRSAASALVDISGAKAKFEEAKAQEDKYTPESWAGFESWLDGQAETLDQADSSKDVTDVLVAFAYRLGQLERKGDKAALEALLKDYTETNPLTKEDYEADSWEAYETAIANAEKVLENANADQADIDKAIKDLTDARTALKIDKTELQSLYDAYSQLKEEEYIADTWTDMGAALEQAKTVLDNAASTAAEVKAAVQDLKDAYEKLEKLPDTDALKALYDELSLLDLNDYMSEGSERMKAALEDAAAVLADPRSEDQVKEQIDALQAAYDALVEKADDTAADALKDNLAALEAVDTGKLSEELQKEVADMISALKDALAKEEISAEDAAELLAASGKVISKADGSLTPDDTEKPGDTDKPGDTEKPSGNNGNGDKAVQTGDMANTGLIVLMLAVSAAAGAAVILRRRIGR